MKRQFVLAHHEARRRATAAVAEAPDGYIVTVAEPTRNLAQNALLWSILTEFSEQLQWPVNGRMTKLAPEEWKDLLSAAWHRESARLAMGLDGGVVMLGLRTSQLGKREFAEFIEFLLATAADRGVVIERPTPEYA